MLVQTDVMSYRRVHAMCSGSRKEKEPPEWKIQEFLESRSDWSGETAKRVVKLEALVGQESAMVKKGFDFSYIGLGSSATPSKVL